MEKIDILFWFHEILIIIIYLVVKKTYILFVC